MNRVETIIWSFCMGILFTFLGLLIMASKNFATSVSIETIESRIILGLMVTLFGVILFNIGIILRKKTNLE